MAAPPQITGHLRPPTSGRTSAILICLVAGLLIGCIYRLIWLEDKLGPDLREQATRQQRRETTFKARRGSILDSSPARPGKHNVLATSYLADSVFVDPMEIDDPAMVVDLLADELKLDGETARRLRNDIALRRSGPLRSTPPLFPWQRRALTPAELEYLREQAVPLQVREMNYWQVDAMLATMPVQSRRFMWVKRLLDRRESLSLRAVLELQSCYVNPSEVKNAPAVIAALNEALELNDSVQQRLAAEIDRRRALPKGDPDREHVWVVRLISPERAEAVRKVRRAGKLWSIGLTNELRGIGLQGELKRDYPAGPLASHVLGYVGAFGEGLEGVERRFDETLSGTDGTKRVIADVRGRPLWSAQGDYQAPADGLSIVLNIDAVIQGFTEQVLIETCAEYQAESGVAIVMDPRTGAILAMANAPTYVSANYQDAPADYRRNRCLTDPFEPGSIFKWVVVAGALDQGVVRESDRFDAHGGTWNHRGRTIRDSHGYGMLTVREALSKSSNIVMAQIALKMGNDRLYECLRDFGFGQKTGIELSGAEDPGLLYPLSRWTSYSAPSLSFGQEITVTAVQMVRAFSIIANGGVLLRPRLVRAYAQDDSDIARQGDVHIVEDFSPEALRSEGKWEEKRVIRPDTARKVIDILTDAVETGTGRRARIEGTKVFGKTGTAQIADGRTGRYLDKQFTASFIAGAPAENPRLVVLVSIRKPNPQKGYYGGTVAAPAVRKIMMQALPFLKTDDK